VHYDAQFVFKDETKEAHVDMGLKDNPGNCPG
jgi:hypothetical protein